MINKINRNISSLEIGYDYTIRRYCESKKDISSKNKYF